VALYFAYAAVVPVARQLMWVNLIHALPAGAALFAVCADRGLDGAVIAVAVGGTVGVGYGIVLFGFEGLLPPPTGGVGGGVGIYVYEALLLATSVAYVVTCGIIAGTGATAVGDKVYAAALHNEGVSVRRSFELLRPEREWTVVGFQIAAERGADRIYHTVIYLVRPVLMLDTVMFVTLVLMLDGGADTQWYEWFEVVRVLTVLAGFVLVPFLLPTMAAFYYLAVAAAVCLITDAMLLGFLVDSSSGALTAMRAICVVLDVYYLAVFILTQIQLPKGSTLALRYNMMSLGDRLSLFGRLIS